MQGRKQSMSQQRSDYLIAQLVFFYLTRGRVRIQFGGFCQVIINLYFGSLKLALSRLLVSFGAVLRLIFIISGSRGVKVRIQSNGEKLGQTWKKLENSAPDASVVATSREPGRDPFSWSRLWSRLRDLAEPLIFEVCLQSRPA